jgi:signal transduction histidine kinase
MIQSNFAITRVLVIPYGVLLALHLAVVGGGGIWLYHQVRAVETRLLVDDMIAAIEPFADRLRSGDAIASMRDREAWLVADIERLFLNMPALRNVSVRGPDSGYQMDSDVAGILSSRAVPALSTDVQRAGAFGPPYQRLHGETDALFLVRFDISQVTSPLVRLDFAFDRSMLLARINGGLVAIERSILLFGIVGTLSILIALGITVVAMRTTRKLEGHFQEIYQRASLTETAAQLVHDLRNPLAALRANAKALLVTPQQTHEIVEELDRDIVTLNDKLSAFLNLTRQRDEELEPVDISELIYDAVRLAEPALAQHGLTVETDIAPGLPHPEWQKASMRDALLNVILNAGQSGQQDGSIRVAAQSKGGALEIVVEDRGEGISERDMPRLFDTFYTTRDDGNGLGLAIVQRIVLSHQGQVHAESRPGGGARIVFTLPWQRKETPHWWSGLKRHFPA